MAEETIESLKKELAEVHARLEAALKKKDKPGLLESLTFSEVVDHKNLERALGSKPFVFAEKISFADDSGYTSNIGKRAASVIDRAFTPGLIGLDAQNALDYHNLPEFDQKNKVCVLVWFE